MAFSRITLYPFKVYQENYDKIVEPAECNHIVNRLLG